jgi:hypothetical protein
LALRRLLAASAIAVAGLARCGEVAASGVTEQLSRAAESIHQEVVFHASAARVHAALTTTIQFDAVVRLRAAMRSGVSQWTKPTTVDTTLVNAE